MADAGLMPWPITIGLRYRHKDAWVGGIYYVRNLVRGLGLLPPGRRPRLVMIGGDAEGLEDLRSATDYTDLRRISRARLTLAPPRRWRPPFSAGPEEIDMVLMGSSPGLEARGVQWVPDFQEHRFPQYFPPEELAARRRRNEEWFSRHRHVMVSSRDVAEDLERYYGRLGARAHVARFASFTEADMEGVDLGDLRRRYGLPDRYFICNNQFWRHKNHGLVLRALAEVEGDLPPVVFTGLEEDYRDPAYGPSVRGLAHALGVAHRTIFLGFLPRGDQLGLMAGAVAVLQPSLCEGWSTVIEDAKAVGRHVLASDIAVHREQLQSGVHFFPPEDPAALAGLLRRLGEQDPPPRNEDYAFARRRFADDLSVLIAEVHDDLRRSRAPRILISD